MIKKLLLAAAIAMAPFMAMAESTDDPSTMENGQVFALPMKIVCDELTDVEEFFDFIDQFDGNLPPINQFIMMGREQNIMCAFGRGRVVYRGPQVTFLHSHKKFGDFNITVHKFSIPDSEDVKYFWTAKKAGQPT